MRSATKQQCYKIRISYGIVRVMLDFLLPLEVIELQALDKFFYEVAVSRV